MPGGLRAPGWDLEFLRARGLTEVGGGGEESYNTCTYMNNQSLRQGKAEQLRLKTTPFFSRELPQAGFEPATFCILGRRSTN